MSTSNDVLGRFAAAADGIARVLLLLLLQLLLLLFGLNGLLGGRTRRRRWRRRRGGPGVIVIFDTRANSNCTNRTNLAAARAGPTFSPSHQNLAPSNFRGTLHIYTVTVVAIAVAFDVADIRVAAAA
jgi:hypothetical protein